jgi:outer membrane murein-binding lipoprotein Lpp
MKGSFLVKAVVPLGMVVAMGAASGVAAGSNGLPQQLQDLLEQIGVLQDSVNEVQDTVNAASPADQSKMRVTPPAYASAGDDCECEVVNVSSVQRTVLVELVGGNGMVLQQASPTLDPGKAFYFYIDGPGGLVYCRFTLQDADGSRTDIRANVGLFRPSDASQGITGSDNVLIPAE